MKHHKSGRTLGRVLKVRRALLRSLASSLVLHEKIMTTEAKAKELRPFVEKLVTRSKNNTVASKRLIIGRIGKGMAEEKLFKVLGPRYLERRGGYTRITKFPPRSGDGSSMAQIEFV
ncbi:MAG: 50S ribosomal protein L17 [bacterium]|nr:50S ribosomal protein L17 [bacterium]